jgi:hypothetical protein
MAIDNAALMEGLDADTEALVRRLQWRAKLNDADCRSLAYEYRVREDGIKHGGLPPDECLLDAWLEYKTRFGTGSPQKEFVSRQRQSSLKRSDRKRRDRS